VARGNALRVVNMTDTPSEPPPGDEGKTVEAMAGWKDGQRKCRARRRHNWGPFAVWEHRSYYDVVEQCAHCRNRRQADFNKSGRQLTRWKADYRDGYLLPKGAMRITPDLRDELVLGDILSRRIVEVVEDEEEASHGA
jgi:hypothetical protein